LGRTECFYRWQACAAEWPLPFSARDRIWAETGPAPRRLQRQTRCRAVNFASQDYPAWPRSRIKAKRPETIERLRRHIAGSPALVGTPRIRFALERQISESSTWITSFCTRRGWGACFGIVQVPRAARPLTVVMDMLSHSCLQERRESRPPTTSIGSGISTTAICPDILAKIRANDKDNGILVITEGLFSDVPRTRRSSHLQELCHYFQGDLASTPHTRSRLPRKEAAAISRIRTCSKIPCDRASSRDLRLECGFPSRQEPRREGISSLLAARPRPSPMRCRRTGPHLKGVRHRHSFEGRVFLLSLLANS